MADDTEEVRLRAEKFSKITDDFLGSQIASVGALPTLLDSLKKEGANPEEAESYLEFALSRLQRERTPPVPDSCPTTPVRPSSPSNLSGAALDSARKKRDVEFQAALEKYQAEKQAYEQRQQQRQQQHQEELLRGIEEVQWAELRKKLLRSAPPSGTGFSLQDILAQIGSSPSRGLPQALLDGAPHLGSQSITIADEILSKTWELRHLYGQERHIDPLIIHMQQQMLDEPVPRSIWKDIILDRAVNFEKLYASMESNYDHDDNPKSFHGDYVITKRSHLLAKKPLINESDWTRVFDAWKDAVLLLYPHRSSELSTYRKIVLEVFRATPSQPSAAISFDQEARESYAKSPFRLDQRENLHVPLLKHLMRNKRALSPSSDDPNKRPKVVCLNWNAGICASPCIHDRTHNICTICTGPHRACDNAECSSKFWATRRAKAQPTLPSSKPPTAQPPSA